METVTAQLSGRLVDEHGQPPGSSTITVVQAIERRGEAKFIRVGSDEVVDADGHFAASLTPGTYYLRFFGMLRPAPGSKPIRDPLHLQKHCFDFISPNADHVSRGQPFALRLDRDVHDLLIPIPRPEWFAVSGRVAVSAGQFPPNAVIMWQREMGISQGVGGVGFPVQPDGTFSGAVLKGLYRAAVHEMTPPEGNDPMRSVRKLSPLATVLVESDLPDVDVSCEKM